MASRGCPSILSRRHPWQHEKASASLQASCSWRSLMPVAAGISQGNCTLILSAAVCHSDNMSAESVERIDWDDDMSSWSSAFDPLPPPPESPKKSRRLGRRRRRRRRKRSRRRTEPRRPARRGNAPLQMSQPVSMGPSRCPKRAHPETKPPNLKQPHPPLRPKTKVAGSFKLSGNPATHHTRRYHVQDNVPVRRLQKCW